MVGAEDRPPAVEQLFADGSAAGAVAVGLQVAGGVQDQLPAGGRVVAQRGGGEHVRGELGVGGPAGRILRVAGGGGGQQRHHLLGGGLLPVGGKLLADHRLHQPVHLEAVGVAAGQGVADQRADGVGEGVGIGGGGAQRLVQQVGVVAEQGQRNGFGGEEGGQLQQLHRGRVLAAQPLQRQRPGGVDPPGIADHVAAGEQGRPAGAEPAQIVRRPAGRSAPDSRRPARRPAAGRPSSAASLSASSSPRAGIRARSSAIVSARASTSTSSRPPSAPQPG